ncbi:striatin-3 isoform X7 [Rhincodon typus]|uniref:striatin-3 isoform X7 n=1 Tax=Rhincodon typus TaxID=259920 RepID=UPI0020306C61|nr:striatin-3 isoform X7 [Rhincodon typus]
MYINVYLFIFRAKYHKLKYGTELNQGDLKMPTFETEETKDTEVQPTPQNSQLTWKQGRQLLRQYLQEVGYTDTILDVRSQRVRSLLGLSGPEQNGSVETKNLEQILNGGDSPTKQKGQEVKRNSGDKPRGGLAEAVLETFNFLENTDDDSDDDEEEGEMVEDITDSKEKHRINKKHKIGNEGLATDLPDDTEEALKEFDFLVTAEDGEGAGEARSSGDGTEWAEPLAFPSGTGKSFIMGPDDVLESVLGLGDLADLTVANDADFSYDLPANKDAYRKTWNPKYTLRSHFDGVRALVFHPVEPVLVTASEDHTLKLWNLQKTVPAKNSGGILQMSVATVSFGVGDSPFSEQQWCLWRGDSPVQGY